MKLFAAISSWVGMIASCVLLSLGLVELAYPLAIVASVVRMAPPREKARHLWSSGFFIGLLPLWGVFVTAPRAHWSVTEILITRVVAVLLFVLTAGWCLSRDWHRFRISDETHMV